MSDFLLYWKEFWRESNDAAATEYFWHTKQKSFFDRAKPDDRLWVVVRGSQGHPEEWRLLQRIVVQEKVINYELDRPYEIIGNPVSSQTFDIVAQTDLTGLLQKLEFVSGKRITVSGGAIGNTLEAIRPLSEADGALLERYSGVFNQQSLDHTFDGGMEEVKVGAGFGDPERNRKVEVAAVSFTAKWYESRGWTVESVESKKCGYDLLCLKGSSVEHVEVKGANGDSLAFIITNNEVREALEDPRFVLCVVTSALRHPQLSRYLGNEFADEFELTPLAFTAKLRIV